MKVSVVIVTYERESETIQSVDSILRQAGIVNWLDKIVVIDNSISSDYADFLDRVESDWDGRVHYYRSPRNLGVSGGRNEGVKYCTGDCVLFIDDDAELVFENTVNLVVKILECNAKIGAIAFKSIDHYTREINVNEFPHRNKEYMCREGFFTYMYVGVAHVIRRNVLTKIGCYPEDFFYGMEEYDYSYKIINGRWDIYYDSRLVVSHKKSQKGRQNDNRVRMLYAKNKIRVAYRNLPMPLLVSHIFLWVIKYNIDSRLDFFGTKKLLLETVEGARVAGDRNVISWKSVFKIFRIGGSVIY